MPIATSPGRSGFGPELSLSYDSGSGNGPFGLGFHLSVPAVTRKTDKGLPRYWDEEESDVYVMSGAGRLGAGAGPRRQDATIVTRVLKERIRTRPIGIDPRVEGAFVRIERWVHNTTRASHWRVITKENVTHIYGRSGKAAQIVDPADDKRIFSWLIEESRDDKGNVIRYVYKAENGENVPYTLSEKSRFDATRTFAATSQRYLKRILYGNRVPFAPVSPVDPANPACDECASGRLPIRGGFRLRRACCYHADTNRKWLLGIAARSILREPLRLRGADLPTV